VDHFRAEIPRYLLEIFFQWQSMKNPPQPRHATGQTAAEFDRDGTTAPAMAG
jgi:hypothetical protein